MAKAANIIRETDPEAIRLARTLIATARHAALGVVLGETGHPGASRVALATDFDGAPIILVSALSWHTQALAGDPRCSLLVGEVGKGDPLAHPRITLFGRAEPVTRNSEAGQRVKRRYLSRQPKAALYADFGDFTFFRIIIDRASLNGGFGKAYELTSDDLAMLGDAAGIAAIEAGAVQHMNEDHAEAVGLYATVNARAKPGQWRLAALDSEGMDLTDGDRTCRVWYSAPLAAADKLRSVLATMATDAREKREAQS
ncbi:HugZ family protein [Oricola sp.]|uniref:HugZ family pyridoxamine 5'-phosphate oxidase n=1 Tax=Oricola sp. TaxID=1979950 RepID=UPI003BAB4D62